MAQVEFALTQVFDRPVWGRVFFEEVMLENLDLGRPDHSVEDSHRNRTTYDGRGCADLY